MSAKQFAIEWFALDALKGHPDNPRSHPVEQVCELKASLDEDDWLQNVVVSSDGYLLGGHGICEAAVAAGHKQVPGYQYPHPHDDPRSLKVMVKLNTLGMPRPGDPKAPVDDADQLSQLLEAIRADGELLGTGHDDASLAALLEEVANANPPTGHVPDEFKEYDPAAMEFEHQCPKCGYEWSNACDAGDS